MHIFIIPWQVYFRWLCALKKSFYFYMKLPKGRISRQEPCWDSFPLIARRKEEAVSLLSKEVLQDVDSGCQQTTRGSSYICSRVMRMNQSNHIFLSNTNHCSGTTNQAQTANILHYNNILFCYFHLSNNYSCNCIMKAYKKVLGVTNVQ